jgi:hypothetical protein
MGEVAEVMFQIGEWPWEIICLLVVLENVCEFDEAMFQGVESSYELILCILGIEKMDFDEFACQD